MNWKALLAVVVIVAAAAFVWRVLDRTSTEETVQVEPIVEQQDTDQAAKTVKETLAVESEPEYQQTVDEIIKPPAKVDDSDEPARQAAADLSSTLAQWLTPVEQIRKWVALIDQMAAGKVPSRNLPVTYNKDSFKVLETDTGLVADPANYLRWNLLVDTVTALDPKRVAVYYKKWSPLLESSYNELGNPQSFDNQFRSTLDAMVAVQPVSADARLKQPKVFYEYADPRLENASQLSKWLWRLGPDNLVKLQSWLKELQSLL